MSNHTDEELEMEQELRSERDEKLRELGERVLEILTMTELHTGLDWPDKIGAIRNAAESLGLIEPRPGTFPGRAEPRGQPSSHVHASSGEPEVGRVPASGVAVRKEADRA